MSLYHNNTTRPTSILNLKPRSVYRCRQPHTTTHTLQPTPHIPHPTPHTPHPTPHIPHSTLHTPHPTPCRHASLMWTLLPLSRSLSLLLSVSTYHSLFRPLYQVNWDLGSELVPPEHLSADVHRVPHRSHHLLTPVLRMWPNYLLQMIDVCWRSPKSGKQLKPTNIPRRF